MIETLGDDCCPGGRSSLIAIEFDPALLAKQHQKARADHNNGAPKSDASSVSSLTPRSSFSSQHEESELLLLSIDWSKASDFDGGLRGVPVVLKKNGGQGLSLPLRPGFPTPSPMLPLSRPACSDSVLESCAWNTCAEEINGLSLTFTRVDGQVHGQRNDEHEKSLCSMTRCSNVHVPMPCLPLLPRHIVAKEHTEPRCSQMNQGNKRQCPTMLHHFVHPSPTAPQAPCVVDVSPSLQSEEGSVSSSWQEGRRHIKRKR
jgi:hypothetical protein